jgi:hypothetical protein
MRAAAVAIVFILGAAVMLVFANSLNSWVLGGLIGGLAALLISIPISVMLFSFLSRRHDLKLEDLHEELNAMGYADQAVNGYEEVYEADAYVLSDEEYDHQMAKRRRAEARALPAAGQSQATAHREFDERAGRPIYQNNRRPTQTLAQGRGKGTPTRDLSVDRRQARRSTYEVNAMRSRFQTSALRSARREAQEFDDVEVIPIQAPNKRVSAGRSSQPSSGQLTRSRQARPTHELPQQQVSHSNGSNRINDTTSGRPNNVRRALSSEEQYSANKPPQTDSLRMEDFQPERFRIRPTYPETEALHAPTQTNQMERNPLAGRPQHNPGMMTGDLKTPLVRRAPYLYENDPLRQELAQQIESEPIVRRSSRYLHSQEDE